jgi:uncharacterized protein (DUF433 family)
MPALLENPLVAAVKPVSPDALAGDLIPCGHPLFGVVWINPDRLGGTPCFYGSRVPLQNLFDYLEGGAPLAEFLDHFEGVTREQAVAVIDLARAGLLEDYLSGKVKTISLEDFKRKLGL